MKRIFHTWDEWECYPAGFYDVRPAGRPALSDEDARQEYADFLADTEAFAAALKRVITEWPNSCEHYLSNERMNRIAWLGQASACIAQGLPSRFKGGFNRLTPDQQHTANLTALAALNEWLAAHGEPELTLDQAASKTEMDLY